MTGLGSLLDELADEGLVEDVDGALAASAELDADPLEAELPWYLRAIVAAGAWLTAIFLLFWLVFALVVAADIDEGIVVAGLSALLGMGSLAVSMLAAWWPVLVRRGLKQRLAEDGETLPTRGRAVLFARTVGLDFLGQMGVVGVLAGQGGFAIGMLDLVEEGVVFVILIAQSLVLLTNPHFALRFLSAAGVGLWAMALEYELAESYQLTIAALTLALVAWWLSRPLWLRTMAWAAHGPIGHGLAAFVLLAHVLANDTLGQPVVNAAAALLVCVVILREARVGALGIALAALGSIAAGVATAPVPGVLLSLLVLGLGARAGDRVLQGAAVLGLLGYGVYDTIVWDVAHEVRFAILLGLGIALSAAAAALRWSGAEAREATA